jgi:hypothetical protein
MFETFLACCIGGAKHSMLFTRQKHILQSLGEDTIKWINGTQNSPLLGTHVICGIHVLVYYLNFVIFIPSLPLCVGYIFIFLNIYFFLFSFLKILLWCILYIHIFYHIKMNQFFQNHILIFHNFQGQKHIWTKFAQICYKNEFQQL